MRLHRFYIKEGTGSGSSFRTKDVEILHQLRDVFRLEVGDEVIFFDGSGVDMTYKIEMISKKEGVFVKEREGQSIMPKKRMTLYMSLIKKDLFELVLQKCTELGVTHFVPMITERTQMKNINTERAEKIVTEASEQCGRGDVPTIGPITNLELVITNYKEGLIALDISGEPIHDCKLLIDNCSVLIGPEGGWSEKEIELFKQHNIQIFKLGDTVLRAETAAIVASAMVMI